ncbi:amidase [Frankia sp. CNm7]|nr:amidase [Frankia nepalensis]
MYRDAFFIDGAWSAPTSADRFGVISPSSEQVVGEVPVATGGDIDTAVAAARAAFDDGPWPRLAPAERGEVLARAAKLLAERAGAIAAVTVDEIGCPVSNPASQTGLVAPVFDYYATLAASYPFERTVVAGAPAGPLRGLSVAVKDLFAVRGYPTGAGNPTWLAQARPEPDHAPAVAALLAAGADVAGIAQTDELAYSLSGTNVHYGTPPNPTAPGVVPGGSSSGPASAVALGLADVGLGTDTGGSVRVPASYCALFGIRPSHGAVSTAGVVPLAPSFDTVGWLARDAATLARVGAVLLPPADRAAPAPAELLLADDLTTLAEPEVAAALTAAVPGLAASVGLPVRRVPAVAGGRLGAWLTAFRHCQGHEAHLSHGSWVAAHPGALGPGVAARFAAAAAVTAEQVAAARATRAQARAALAAALGGGAVLVAPASSSPAPPVDLAVDVKDRVRAATLTLTCAAGLAGLPVVVLPLLRVRDRPVGVALVGAAGTDRALLTLATRACPAAY